MVEVASSPQLIESGRHMSHTPGVVSQHFGHARRPRVKEPVYRTTRVLNYEDISPQIIPYTYNFL